MTTRYMGTVLGFFHRLDNQSQRKHWTMGLESPCRNTRHPLTASRFGRFPLTLGVFSMSEPEDVPTILAFHIGSDYSSKEQGGGAHTS
jgi:hypothetical protein